ncbi:MAG: hypothetical protein NC043_05565 [Muribaculaceae bacterium]|nr:hypothetical protein [Muribaculaceae bacterium]
MTPKTRTLILAIASVAIIAYLVVMAVVCSHLRAERVCEGIDIVVVDSTSQHFVTETELRHELGRLPALVGKVPLASIDTDSLQRMLRVIDKIENARVERLTDGTIRITVEPMRPVARIFDGNTSYYINKDGKRISAEARYFVDVPVIQGHFRDGDTLFTPLSLLPLVEYVESNERWNNVVSLIKADSPRDVLLIPAMRRLVFNLGTPDGFNSKFARLDRMISEVIPQKGWAYYDTISVKWAGQIVATRSDKFRPRTETVIEEDDEQVDVSTMTAGANVAPGQSLPGRKANSEKPVPGAKPMPVKAASDSAEVRSAAPPKDKAADGTEKNPSKETIKKKK